MFSRHHAVGIFGILLNHTCLGFGSRFASVFTWLESWLVMAEFLNTMVNRLKFP